MTLADPSPPSMEFSIIDFIFFLNPSLTNEDELSCNKVIHNITFLHDFVTPALTMTNNP